MSKAKGWAARMGAGVEDYYGDAVTVTDLIPFLGESIAYDKPRQEDLSLVGDAGFNRSFTGQETDVGPIRCNLGYGDLDLLIAAAMGDVNPPSLQTDLYYTQYELTDEVDESLTLAQNKQVSIHEWRGSKINKLTMRGTPTNPIEMEVDVVAKDRLVTGTTNDASDITGATEYKVPVIMFEDLSIFVGDNADVLTSADEISISGFEFVLDNMLRTDEMTNKGLAEPERNARRRVTLRLDLPSYESDTYFTWLQQDTIVQVQMRFEKASADYTDKFQFIINLGKMTVAEYPTPTEGEEITESSISLRALRAAGDSATWASMTEEFELYVQNTRGTSPLA